MQKYNYPENGQYIYSAASWRILPFFFCAYLCFLEIIKGILSHSGQGRWCCSNKKPLKSLVDHYRVCTTLISHSETRRMEATFGQVLLQLEQQVEGNTSLEIALKVPFGSDTYIPLPFHRPKQVTWSQCQKKKPCTVLPSTQRARIFAKRH